jgi:DNA-nicking Smr family endonuclease
MAKKPAPFHNPFGSLKLKPDQAEKAKSPKPVPTERRSEKPKPDIVNEEAQLFLQSVGEVQRVRTKATRIGPKAPPSIDAIRIPTEEAESLARLAELVSGEAAFSLADSDEFVEGAVLGFDERVLRKLRTGAFSVGAHLDLHGLLKEEAKAELERFIAQAKLKGLRCVLIVTGRGLHSKDSIPVLKAGVQQWLSRGKLAKHVLAFCTARPVDGGAGAMYVLLRR